MALDQKPPAGEWPLAIVLVTALLVGVLWIVVAFLRALVRSSVSWVRGHPEAGLWAQVEHRLGLGDPRNGSASDPHDEV